MSRTLLELKGIHKNRYNNAYYSQFFLNSNKFHHETKQRDVYLGTFIQGRLSGVSWCKNWY